MNKFCILNPFANQGQELCHSFKEKGIQHLNTHPKMGQHPQQEGKKKATQPPHPGRHRRLESQTQEFSLAHTRT